MSDDLKKRVEALEEALTELAASIEQTNGVASEVRNFLLVQLVAWNSVLRGVLPSLLWRLAEEIGRTGVEEVFEDLDIRSAELNTEVGHKYGGAADDHMKEVDAAVSKLVQRILADTFKEWPDDKP